MIRSSTKRFEGSFGYVGRKNGKFHFLDGCPSWFKNTRSAGYTNYNLNEWIYGYSILWKRASRHRGRPSNRLLPNVSPKPASSWMPWKNGWRRSTTGARPISRESFLNAAKRQDSNTYAVAELDNLEKKWGEKYPYAILLWKNNWEELTIFFQIPLEIRKIIYTTNLIENLNGRTRKYTKSK